MKETIPKLSKEQKLRSMRLWKSWKPKRAFPKNRSWRKPNPDFLNISENLIDLFNR